MTPKLPTVTPDTDGQWIVSCPGHRVFVKFETEERAIERSREHEAEASHWVPDEDDGGV